MSHRGTVKVDKDIWIKHFMLQAKDGAAPRSSFNRHFIVVHPWATSAALDDDDNLRLTDTEKEEELERKKETVPVVSPVEQSVQQVQSEIERAKSGDGEKQMNISEDLPIEGISPGSSKLEKKSKVSACKRRVSHVGVGLNLLKKRKTAFTDIFS